MRRPHDWIHAPLCHHSIEIRVTREGMIEEVEAEVVGHHKEDFHTGSRFELSARMENEGRGERRLQCLSTSGFHSVFVLA